jgi:hypothetical protein
MEKGIDFLFQRLDQLILVCFSLAITLLNPNRCGLKIGKKGVGRL